MTSSPRLRKRTLTTIGSTAVLLVALSACSPLLTIQTGSSEVPATSTAADPAATAATEGAQTDADLALTEEEAAAAADYTRFFADDSPWNTVIEDATVDTQSDTLIDLAKERIAATERKGSSSPRLETRSSNEGIYVNTTKWTVPVAEGGVSTTLVCRQVLCGDGNSVSSLPVPSDMNPDPEYDGWFSIVDGGYVYDLWRARREADGSISYQFMRKWDLSGPGYSEPEVVSARGSGLPLVGGLIRPEELAAGEINHAIAIAVPGPASRSYVQPASVTDGGGAEDSLPEGARIRLKSGVTLSNPVDPDTGEKIRLTAEQRRTAQIVMTALRKYGAIVVERSEVPTLFAERDATTSLLTGNELQSVTLDDFEVLTLGEILKDPPLESADQDGTAILDTDTTSGENN